MIPITIEGLLAEGWVRNTGDAALFAPIEKELSEPGQEYDEGEYPLALEVNHDFNQQQFSLRLCDGAKLDLRFESIEDIRAFEKTVMGWRGNY